MASFSCDVVGAAKQVRPERMVRRELDVLAATLPIQPKPCPHSLSGAHGLVTVGMLTALNMPNKCHDGGAKAHACANEMQEIHRPNGGEGRASEHADKT